MASHARCFFQSAGMLAGDFDFKTMQENAALLAEPSAEIPPFVCRRTQPVVDMRGFERVAKARLQVMERIEQYD
jgi:hypothetical protein